MWNTGCNFVANDTTGAVYILDGEDTGYSLNIPQQKIVNFNGVIFPWCNRSEEIVNKAFRVYQGNNDKGTLLFYMFQNYDDNMVYYSTNGQWANIVRCADEPSSYLNVLITRDNRPVCSKG